MKGLKWLAGVVLVYVVFVVIFETVYLGYMQPSFEEGGIPMLLLTTTDDNGNQKSRMLARFELDDALYVSAHHWPRGWYHRAIANPNVTVEVDEEVTLRTAIPVDGEEFASVAQAYPLPLVVRALMGFPPPRDILRLDRR